MPLYKQIYNVAEVCRLTTPG